MDIKKQESLVYVHPEDIDIFGADIGDVAQATSLSARTESSWNRAKFWITDNKLVAATLFIGFLMLLVLLRRL